MAFYPLPPCRIADTRPPARWEDRLGWRNNAFLSLFCQARATYRQSLRRIRSTFTVIPATTLSYLATWPSGQSQPVESNFQRSDRNRRCKRRDYPSGDFAELWWDFGLCAILPRPEAAASRFTLAPCRAVDTRSSSGQFNGNLPVNIAGSCGVQSVAQAFVLNATARPAGSLSTRLKWSDGQSQPNTSTFDALDGAVTSNLPIVARANDSINLFASDPTQLILDLSSYFAP